MNVFDEIQASRPDVEPLPLAERRRIRESLFGIGYDDTTRTITGRSESGAVVSTAPHGTRRPLQKGPRAAGSFAKIGAGLLVFAVLGAAVWSFSTRDEAVETAEPTATVVTATTTTTTTTTLTPTTVAPSVRTGVSASMPLALPPTQLPVDEAAIGPAAAGSSSAILSAPDGTEVWLAEFDGEPSDVSNLDIRDVGTVRIGVDGDLDDGAPASYRPLVPCGFVIVNDAPGQPLDRQPIIDLFSAMSIDLDATIDIALPTDWSVFSIGESKVSYTAQFQVPTTDEGVEGTAPISITQVPDGSFAQLMFGGRQLDPVEFLGAPAFIDIGSPDPSLASVFWQDADTVFNASSSGLTIADIEEFVDSFEPAAAEDWSERFASARPEAVIETPTCAPQPDFGPTLAP